MENSVTKVSINDIPKWMKIVSIIFPVLGVFVISRDIDNDFYFLYKMGEYICNNGFPLTDILSMHSEMKLVVQQWVCDVIFYKLYNFGGFNALFSFMSIVYILFVVFFYKLCNKISNNYFVSIVITTLSGVIISTTFFTTRPQILTYLVFILLFYALESYISTNKWYWLAILPLLSFFLINWHASMWWLMFVFMLPYLVNALPFHFKKLKQEPCCNIFALIITMVIMLAVGFINPYGKDAVIYLFGSYGVDEINNLIQEMQPNDIGDLSGKLLFGIFFVLIIIFANNEKQNIKSRFVCLALGTTILALSSVKGIAYFVICTFFPLAYFLKDFDIKLSVSNKKRTKKEKIKLIGLIIVFCMAVSILIASLCSNIMVDEEKIDENNNRELVVNELDHESKDKMILYADFNNGQYLEFRGYKPYIDGRAEVFLEKNNKSFDYFIEYADLISGKIYYKDFVNKYNFTHLIVANKSKILLQGLKHDLDYVVIYENEDYTLFKQVR